MSTRHLAAYLTEEAELLISTYEGVSCAEDIQSSVSSPEVSIFDIATVEDEPLVIFGGILIGSVVWGHDTDDDEDNVEDLASWSGTGVVSGSGDTEEIEIETG